MMIMNNTSVKYTKVAFGIISTCEDNSHIFMCDTDHKDNPHITLELFTNIINNIIDEYNLSNVFIVESTNGYNAYSLDKIPLRLLYEINKSYPNVLDQTYNELMYTRRGFYVLRIGHDKKIVDILSSPHDIYKRSNAHRIFFNSVFGLHVDRYHSFDDFERFRIIRFLNNKHGVDLE